MTIPRLELGISRVSGERVSHCTIQSYSPSQILTTCSLGPLQVRSFSTHPIRNESLHFVHSQGVDPEAAVHFGESRVLAFPSI